MDADHDGKISKDEVLKAFSSTDKDNDGNVTRREFIQAIMASAGQNSDGGQGAKPGAEGRHHGVGRPHWGPHHPGIDGRGPGRGGFGGPGPHHAPSAAGMLERFDKDRKGSLTKQDVPKPVWNHISKADANNDGSVSKDELEAHIKKVREERQKDQKPSAPADAKQPKTPVEDHLLIATS